MIQWYLLVFSNVPATFQSTNSYSCFLSSFQLYSVGEKVQCTRPFYGTLCKFYFPPNLRQFGAIMPSNIFSVVFLSFLSVWNSHYMYVKMLDAAHSSLRLCLLFLNIFFLPLLWTEYFLLIFTFFIATSNLLLNLSNEVFTSITVLCKSKISIWLLFCFSSEIFNLLSVVSPSFNYLNIFITMLSLC